MHKVLAENELKRLLRGSKYIIVGKAGGQSPRGAKEWGWGGGAAKSQLQRMNI